MKDKTSSVNLQLKLSESVSRLCRTIAQESDVGLIPAIGDDIQTSSVSASFFTPSNTLRQTVTTFMNKVSQQALYE